MQSLVVEQHDLSCGEEDDDDDTQLDAMSVSVHKQHNLQILLLDDINQSKKNNEMKKTKRIPIVLFVNDITNYT